MATLCQRCQTLLERKVNILQSIYVPENQVHRRWPHHCHEQDVDWTDTSVPVSPSQALAIAQHAEEQFVLCKRCEEVVHGAVVRSSVMARAHALGVAADNTIAAKVKKEQLSLFHVFCCSLPGVFIIMLALLLFSEALSFPWAYAVCSMDGIHSWREMGLGSCSDVSWLCRVKTFMLPREDVPCVVFLSLVGACTLIGWIVLTLVWWVGYALHGKTYGWAIMSEMAALGGLLTIAVFHLTLQQTMITTLLVVLFVGLGIAQRTRYQGIQRIPKKKWTLPAMMEGERSSYALLLEEEEMIKAKEDVDRSKYMTWEEEEEEAVAMELDSPMIRPMYGDAVPFW